MSGRGEEGEIREMRERGEEGERRWREEGEGMRRRGEGRGERRCSPAFVQYEAGPGRATPRGPAVRLS
jgi:hypothetical protein